jgi:hypothetical protein
MFYFLALAGMAKTVFKTDAFNHSAIPPSSMVLDAAKTAICYGRLGGASMKWSRYFFWRSVPDCSASFFVLIRAPSAKACLLPSRFPCIRSTWPIML